MTGEFDIAGVFVPALLVWALLAFTLSIPLRGLLAKLGVYRFVWHRGLFDFCLLVILVGAVSAIAALPPRISLPAPSPSRTPYP